MRADAKYLAYKLAVHVRRQGMSADFVSGLTPWLMARLAENGHEVLRASRSSATTWKLVLRLLDEYRVLPERPHILTAVESGPELCVRVKCLDVEVGSATFDRAVGLAHTTFQPSDDYPMIAPHARDIGKWLAVRRYWRPMDGDVTDIIAEQWRGERLCLENHLGHELAVSHVIISETTPRAPHRNARILLVADFRPDHARIGAVVPTGEVGSGGRNRPAK
jgi:hypothetical protein